MQAEYSSGEAKIWIIDYYKWQKIFKKWLLLSDLGLACSDSGL